MAKKIQIQFVEKNGCHECISHKVGSHGYPAIGEKMDGINYNMVHRFAFAKKFGHFDLSLCVLHKCDNRLCINPDHLFLGTRGDNNKDRHAKGRTSRAARTNGIINGVCKLTPEQIIEIRLSKGAMSASKLSKLYNLSQTHVSAIQGKRVWRHL